MPKIEKFGKRPDKGPVIVKIGEKAVNPKTGMQTYKKGTVQAFHVWDASSADVARVIRGALKDFFGEEQQQ